MISFIKTKFRNWVRRDKVILSHHRLIDSIGSVTIQTAIDLQDVIDTQLAILKRVAHLMEDKEQQEKALDSIARMESQTDVRKAMLEDLKATHAEIFQTKQLY